MGLAAARVPFTNGGILAALESLSGAAEPVSS